MTETTPAEIKDYWDNRNVKPPSRLGSMIKRSAATRGLTDVLFSLRASDEAFLARTLRRRRVRSVLDLACGPGKAVIPSIAAETFGVDIAGFPKEQALAKGYDQCFEYSPPDYEFDLGRQVDAVTAINLNAHIPAESYARILQNGLRALKPGGTLILIHELDNNGLSYRWMHRNREKFRRFVDGMEHWHLSFEDETLKDIAGPLKDMRLIKRSPLIAGFLPSMHYYAYKKERDPRSLLRRLFVLSDIPVSIMNFMQCRLAPNFNKSFLVGYVYEKKL